MLWTDDLRQGAIFLAAFVLPFGLLAVGIARLTFNRRAPPRSLRPRSSRPRSSIAGVGLYQWATREVFWNPKLRGRQRLRAGFFRVNSVFWDPSIYGRYLVVAILANAGLVLLGAAGWVWPPGSSAIVAIWLGLLFSFSQSSFAALIAGTIAAAAVIWRWRAAAALAVLAVVLVLGRLRDAAGAAQLLQGSRGRANSVHGGRAGSSATGSGSPSTILSSASARAASSARTPRRPGSRARSRRRRPRTRRR